jgi:hypothetical protein
MHALVYRRLPAQRLGARAANTTTNSLSSSASGPEPREQISTFASPAKNHHGRTSTMQPSSSRREFAAAIASLFASAAGGGPAFAQSVKEARVQIVRISRGSFDPANGAHFEALLKESEKSLVPAIKKLRGLQHYYAGVDAASGTMVNVSVWNSLEDARQMESLSEMAAAGKQFVAAGVKFERPMVWVI